MRNPIHGLVLVVFITFSLITSALYGEEKPYEEQAREYAHHWYGYMGRKFAHAQKAVSQQSKNILQELYKLTVVDWGLYVLQGGVLGYSFGGGRTGSAVGVVAWPLLMSFIYTLLQNALDDPELSEEKAQEVITIAKAGLEQAQALQDREAKSEKLVGEEAG